jgi:hypothetical protein
MSSRRESRCRDRILDVAKDSDGDRSVGEEG